MRPAVLFLAATTLLAACAGDASSGAGDARGGASGADVDAPSSGEAASAPAPEGTIWREGPRLPAPVANNAVVAVRGRDGVAVYSFLGIDSTKVWSGVSDTAYRWLLTTDAGGSWEVLSAVPGPGRLASTAQVLGGRIFLIGGYTVAEDGSERSVPNVDVFTPQTGSWTRAADMPTPVDDAVSGVWSRTSLILVSGWHDRDNVREVQIFDPSINRWSTGTPIPGAPVFGHSGAVVGNDVVYVGGVRVVAARPRFVIDSTAWRGRIDPGAPATIAWSELPRPPGPPLYRAAVGVLDGVVVFVGGTDNPYNYDGIGYDGVAAEPVDQAIAFDPRRGWLRLPPPPVATMDHRTLGVAGGTVFLVGGMEAGQRVTDRVWLADAAALLSAATPLER